MSGPGFANGQGGAPFTMDQGPTVPSNLQGGDLRRNRRIFAAVERHVGGPGISAANYPALAEALAGAAQPSSPAVSEQSATSERPGRTEISQAVSDCVGDEGTSAADYEELARRTQGGPKTPSNG